jgi:hypothetical protein
MASPSKEHDDDIVKLSGMLADDARWRDRIQGGNPGSKSERR